MNRPSRQLMAEIYPSVPCRPTAGDFDTLLSIEKARKPGLRAGVVLAGSHHGHLTGRYHAATSSTTNSRLTDPGGSGSEEAEAGR